MIYTQTQDKQITLEEFQHNLFNVLTNVVEEKRPYIITVTNFPAISFKLEAQELSDPNRNRNKSIDVIKKLANPLAGNEEYEANQRMWRRSIIEKTAGVIKDTKLLDKELKQRRAYELRAAKKMGRW